MEKKKIAGLIVVVFFVGGFLVKDTFFGGMHIRLSGTSIFSRDDAYQFFQKKQDEMFYDAKLKINLTRRLFHDNTVFTAADIILKCSRSGWCSVPVLFLPFPVSSVR